MNHEFLATIVTALLSSTGGVGVLQWWLSKKQKDKDQQRDKQAEDSRAWYRQSRHHYELATKETAAARAECSKCRHELELTRGVVYILLEEFEDRIIPMITQPDTSPEEVRAAARAAVARARESLSAAGR